MLHLEPFEQNSSDFILADRSLSGAKAVETDPELTEDPVHFIP